MPRCPCDAHAADYDRGYLCRIDKGWPRILAWLAGPPASSSVEKARVNVAAYDRACAEGRVGVGFLGAVITDRETAAEINRTFGMRR